MALPRIRQKIALKWEFVGLLGSGRTRFNLDLQRCRERRLGFRERNEPRERPSNEISAARVSINLDPREHAGG